MKGIHQRSLKGELHHVAIGLETKPVLEIDADLKLEYCREYIASMFKPFVFESDYYKLPLETLENLSFDELCKLYYSTEKSLDLTVDNVFKRRPNYEVIRKIKNSIWRWGSSRGTWNEFVDAWNGIRQFNLDLGSDFEARLDYTTGSNDSSYAKFSGIYIDGVFAFLVYYKRKHVMTIGFSFSGDRQILIQQVQLKQPKGNRWLYKLPKHQLAFVIDLFEKYFPAFTFCVVDGKSLALKTLAQYKRGLQSASNTKNHDHIKLLEARIAHLKREVPRLAALYKNCGRHTLGKTVIMNDIKHYQLT